MQYNDANDDLGTAKKPFKVIACIPVMGRLPLLEHTIKRLYDKNGCYKVICSGDGHLEKQLCESLGAVWVPSPNKPLGAKWNNAFRKAKEFRPDAVVYVGSSDFLSDNWFSVMEPYVMAHHFVGTAECHFVHIGETLQGVLWKGYRATQFHKDRSDETIGIGRMLSRHLMDLLDWKPFYDSYDNSLDRSMKELCKKAGFNDFMVEYGEIKALSLSTDRWLNKHRFSQHWGDRIANEVIDADAFVRHNFPEVNLIFK